MRNDDNKDHYLNSKSQDLFISREYFSCVCDLIIFSLIKMPRSLRFFCLISLSFGRD